MTGITGRWPDDPSISIRPEAAAPVHLLVRHGTHIQSSFSKNLSE